ncbi:rhomboid family intramembrane serine protease [candidate division KSB1 bacterium]|nr:MAG: rhomboid family intramembrane serine protease [candidate division KSB1 bacterium]
MFPIQDTVPRRETPFTTWIIILVNGIVFLFELSLPETSLKTFLYHFGIVPARYSHPEWALQLGLPLDDYWPFLTSMFLHGSWLHFVGNMWCLWLFGDNVEDRMGHIRYLFFYLLCGLVAGLIHFVFNQSSTVPTIGASGAIAGIMGAYFVMFPTARVITLVPIFFLPYFIEIPAVFYLGIWFLTQITSGLFSLIASASGGIAWWAHIGGFVCGIILLPVFRKRPQRYRAYYSDEVFPMRFFFYR